MNKFEQIAQILKRDDVKVEKWEVLMKDMFGDFCERPINSQGIIDLKEGKFLWDDVKSVIAGKIPTIDVRELSTKELMVISEKSLAKDWKDEEIVPMQKEEVVVKVKKAKKGKPQKIRVALRGEQIKLIRQRVAEGKSINAIAAELGVERFPVMYVVKQIKAGKKLRYE